MSSKKVDNGVGPTATLDDAMMVSGMGVYNILNMLMSGLVLAGMITTSVGLGYVIPAAQCDLELNTQQKGWLAALPFVAIIIMSPVWGWLGDTRGRRPVMLWSMVVSIIFAFVQSFAPNLASFAVLQFCASIFMAGVVGVTYTYLGEFNNIRHRDKMVAFGSSFVGIGTVALPLISWLILPMQFSPYISFLGIHYRPWRVLVIACSGPFIIAAILLLFAHESPKFLHASGRYDECLKVIKKIYAINKRVPEDTFPVKSLVGEVQTSTGDQSSFSSVLKSMRDQTVPLFKRPLLIWTCLTCFVQFGIFANVNGFYVWFPTILNSLANHQGDEAKICDILEANQAAKANSTMLACDDSISTETYIRSIYIGLVFCTMYILVGFIVDLVGKKLILITVIGISGACGIAANLVSSEEAAVILFAIFQMSGACIGLMNAAAVELFPTKLRAMAISLSMMTGRMGSVLGSNLIGVFLEVNCGASFYLFGGLLIVCAASCFILPNRKKDKKLVEELRTEVSEEAAQPEPV